ncbi:MAG: TrbC/VirB2 family protein [Bacteriovoracaceae bacterium]|jgi:hypothetical protein|nr:TrbC/VirB2 family protein [Bacteriovoracaceae bacterium]
MTILISLYLLLSDNVYARSLKSTADKLAKETTHIGTGVALFGLGLAAIYFMLGKQDASTKMTQAIAGTLILFMAPNIINFVKGLV